MNPYVFILVMLLWIAAFGVAIMGYLENKLKAWGMVLAILFVLAILATLGAVFTVNTTPIVN